MNRKSKKLYFSLKIAVLILLVIVHYFSNNPDVYEIITQLLKNYHLQDSIIETVNILDKVA